jgi:hypothetical protein
VELAGETKTLKAPKKLLTSPAFAEAAGAARILKALMRLLISPVFVELIGAVRTLKVQMRRLISLAQFAAVALVRAVHCSLLVNPHLLLKQQLQMKCAHSLIKGPLTGIVRVIAQIPGVALVKLHLLSVTHLSKLLLVLC